MFKNFCSKTVFFLVFWLSYRVRQGIWGQNGKMGGVLTIQGQMVEIPLKSPGKFSIFQFYSIFHLSLPKIWQAHPHKILFSKLTRTDLLLHKGRDLEVEDCGLRKHLKLGDLFYHILQAIAKSTCWLNGCHGYHEKVVLLTLPFWRPGKITRHQV